MIKNVKKAIIPAMLFFSLAIIVGCEKSNDEIEVIKMIEKQITNSPKTHALDNNDNFSPDDKYLCYDTRGTVFNNNLANCKSIEKVEIATGKESILWSPPFITGEKAAPGVAACSYHPKENKVIFIHGPLLDEVKERGPYSIKNRTAVVVDGNGGGIVERPDMRDVKSGMVSAPAPAVRK